MAPSKGKKAKRPASAASKDVAPASTQGELPAAPQTIGDIHRAEYLASRPYQVLFETKGWNGLSADEKTAYTNFRLLETEAYKHWPAKEQEEFLKYCEKLKIPHPLPERKGNVEFKHEFEAQRKKVEALSLGEYREYKEKQYRLYILQDESDHFRSRVRNLKRLAKLGNERAQVRSVPGVRLRGGKIEILSPEEAYKERTAPITEADIQEERQRRVKIADLECKKMPGIYEGDPVWDDVVPIPQDDGEKPLAAIAYTDEYAEAISYLRAVMAVNERSPRALELTAHIIDLNPAHYTVWLFRASILFHLKSDLYEELKWVNEVALVNQKNYQIWHHRQLLIENIYPLLSDDRAKVLELARSESAFMAQMFSVDSKNYHVWSYREYFVRKFSIFPSQSSDPSELAVVENLLDSDVRNNSAWAHRYFIVFSDPGHSTEGSRPLERDERLPEELIDCEIEFSKSRIRRAPQSQSGWNYVRGVLKKGGRKLPSLETFSLEFVTLEGEGGVKEVVKSTHALEMLADIWADKSEVERADEALRLLAEKYDPIRKSYWEYRREGLREGLREGAGGRAGS